MSTTEDKLLTVGEAAARLGCKSWHVQRAVERGLYQPYPQRVGPFRVFRESELAALKAVLERAGYLK